MIMLPCFICMIAPPCCRGLESDEAEVSGEVAGAANSPGWSVRKAASDCARTRMVIDSGSAQVPAAVVDLPAQINAPPPCTSADAWKDVAAEPYALQPLPAMDAAAPAPVAGAPPPPPPGLPPPAANGTSPSAPATPANTSAGGGAPTPPAATPSLNTTDAAPAEEASETGEPDAAEDVQGVDSRAVASSAAFAAAAVAACALLLA